MVLQAVYVGTCCHHMVIWWTPLYVLYQVYYYSAAPALELPVVPVLFSTFVVSGVLLVSSVCPF